MTRTYRATMAAALAACFLAAAPAAAQRVRPEPLDRLLERAGETKAGGGGPRAVTGRACVPMTIACGQTRNGNLTSDDCELSDGSFVDFWFFDGTSGQRVTVTLTSSAFDTFLVLLDPQDDPAASDDDGAGGTNSRLSFTLDSTGEWVIGANSLLGGQTGAYTVSLACSGGGGGSVPAAPSDLRATALSSTEVSLAWDDNSGNEASFRIELREPGGSFQEIGSVGANATSAVVESLEPDTRYEFRVRARNSSGNSAYSNTSAATTPGGGGFFTSPEIPGFRFQIEINDQPARQEPCLQDTVCVSGAVRGRSELFVRVIGPRPNGFLWPHIVKFTTSRVEVRIQQISTGIEKLYVLPAVGPSSDDLTGFFDRTGFLP